MPSRTAAQMLGEWNGDNHSAFTAAWNDFRQEVDLPRLGRIVETRSYVNPKTYKYPHLKFDRIQKQVVSGRQIGMDVEVRFDPRFQAFYRRLDQLATTKERAYFRRGLAKVARRHILPTLKEEIPKGGNTYVEKRLRGGPKSYLSSRRRALGAVRTAGRLAGTVRAKAYDDRILITVGSKKQKEGPQGNRKRAGKYGLWTAAIVHSKWKPYFPITFRKTIKPFNKALEEEMIEMMKFLAGHAMIRFGGLLDRGRV